MTTNLTPTSDQPLTIDSYETAMEPARREFSQRMNALYKRVEPSACAMFLMHYSAQGVAMTKDVPVWIRAAGEAAKSKGYAVLGKMLVEHAGHEEGHHEMMDRDIDSLVGWWNERFEKPMNSSSFRDQAPLPAVHAYRQLHLDLIEQAPYAQIAVEYEIERLSTGDGPKLFRRMIGQLDLQVVRCLSFLTEHVAIDAGHTRLNKRSLGRLVANHPETLAELVNRGSAALRTYASYVEGCAELATASVDEFRLDRPRRRPRAWSIVLKEKAAAVIFLLRAFMQGRLGQH